MDNASKALIFAGGILIAVLVISVSIYVITMARGVAKTSNERIEANAVQSYNRFYVAYGNSGTTIKGIDALNIYRKATDDSQKDTILHPILSANIVAPAEIVSMSNAIDSGTGTGTGAEWFASDYTFTYETDVDGYIYKIKIN